MKQILERWEKFLESYGKKIFVHGDGESEEKEVFSKYLIQSLTKFTENSTINVKRRLLPLLQKLADEKAQGKMTHHYLKELEPPPGYVHRGRVALTVEMVEKEGLFKIPYDKLKHGSSWLIPGGVFTPRQDDITSWSYSMLTARQFADFHWVPAIGREKIRALEKEGTPYFTLVMTANSKQPGFLLNHTDINILRAMGEEEVLYIGGELPLRAVKATYFDPAVEKQEYDDDDKDDANFLLHLVESVGKLAKSKKIIQEVLTDVLYQYRSAPTILNILKKNAFFPSVAFATPSEVEINKGYKYYLSFARNLRGTYHRQGKMSAYMVLDGRKLGERFKGSAVNYWGDMAYASGKKKTEVEDRLYTNEPVIKNVAQYIESIHVSIPIEMKSSSGYISYPINYMSSHLETLKELDETAKKMGIPIYYYTDVRSYRMKNTKAAISLRDWKKALPTDQIENFTSNWQPSPTETSRIDAIGKAIESMLIKKQDYYKFLDSLPEEEAKFIKGRLFYSGSANEVADRIRNEIRTVTTKPDARPAINKIAKALRKLKLNLRDAGRALWDVEREARKKRQEEESAKWEASRKRREEEVAKWEAQQMELEK